MSVQHEGRSHRREVKIREYLLKQPGNASGAPSYETAVHVLQDLGLYVSDKRAHDWWCSLFDMIMAGAVIDEPDGSSVRLATADELFARLSADPTDRKAVSSIVMLDRQMMKEQGE
jgi:hypothetical protein